MSKARGPGRGPRSPLPRDGPVRNDRNDQNSDRSKGGGVLIVIHNRFCTNVSLECLAVSFKSSNCKIIIVAIYIPPNSSVDVYKCQCAEIDDLRLIFSDYTFIIVGDFNLPVIKWSNQNHAILSGRSSDKSMVLAETIAYEQFFQHNFIPNYRNNILDLVISDNNTLEVSKCSFPLISVDVAHPPLQINGLNFVSSLKTPFLSSEPNFRRGNYESMNAYLNNIDWDSLLSDSLDFSVTVSNFYSVIHDAINSFLFINIKTSTLNGIVGN